VVIGLEQGADLHMAQLIPLPLAVSCYSKIQIGFAFLVPAYPGSPGKRAVKRVCVCVCVCSLIRPHRNCSSRKPFISLPDIDWVQTGNDRLSGFLLITRGNAASVVWP